MMMKLRPLMFAVYMVTANMPLAVAQQGALNLAGPAYTSPIALPSIGKLKTRSAKEIESANWILGCETLDRDMADFHQYKQYLEPLGIKVLRLQAGWAKTEKVKGKYDWEWLDRIVDDAIARGCEPWLETSYGNQLYPGGGGTNLSAGIPTSPESLAAWDRWVEAMVKRYKEKVKQWEVWNEPNFGDNEINKPEAVAALNIRTAEIIKRIQPGARISGLAMGHIDLAYADSFFKYIHDQKKMHLFDNMTYHDYVYNPDSNYPRVQELRRVLDKYAPGVALRQGENGAPSMGGLGRGAIGDWDWNELSQAKWNTRRMLGDLGHDLECSILGIIDMNYNTGAPITKLNVKGLIQSDSTRRAIRPKLTYYAIQHVTAIFDHSLVRIKNMKDSHNLHAKRADGEIHYNKGTDRSMAVYGYRHRDRGAAVFTLWMDEAIPSPSNKVKQLKFTLRGAHLNDPVLIDILSGEVFEFGKDQWRKERDAIIFEQLPVYDAPVVLIDRSLIAFK